MKDWKKEFWSEPVITESFSILSRKIKLRDPFQIYSSTTCNFWSGKKISPPHQVSLAFVNEVTAPSPGTQWVAGNRSWNLIFHSTVLIEPANTLESAMTLQQGEVTRWTKKCINLFFLSIDTANGYNEHWERTEKLALAVPQPSERNHLCSIFKRQQQIPNYRTSVGRAETCSNKPGQSLIRREMKGFLVRVRGYKTRGSKRLILRWN